MLPPSRYPRQRLLVTLTLASGVPPAIVRGLFTVVGHDSWVRGLFAAGAFMLPTVFIAWLLLGDATRRTLGLVLTYAGFLIIAGGTVLGVLFWYGMAVLVAPLGKVGFLAVEVAVIAPYLALFVVAALTANDLYGRTVVMDTLPQTLSVIVLCILPFALASVFDLDFSRSERRARWAMSDALRRSTLRVQACAIGYALTHPDSGYPRSLAAMGPSGKGCLEKQLASGRPKGHLVEYEPAAPDEGGRIPSFIVRARERESSSSGEFSSTVGDTSGFFSESRSTESATRVERAIEGMIDQIAHLRTCALLARAEHPEGAAASSIADLVAMYGRFSRADFSAHLCDWRRLRHSARLEAKDSLDTSMGYGVSYVGLRDSLGRVRDFEIVARPIAYGKSGIRSYFVRSDGPIHVTLADRAATTSDPVAPACEYGEKWNTLPRYTSAVGCVRMPSVRPPVVTLVHDSVATAGEPFTVAVRDAADASRPADATYEHYLSCTTLPRGLWLAPQHTYDVFQRGSELSCRIPGEARSGPFADPVRIVVYTRDRSGAIGRAEGVVRIVAR